jgi:Ca-activated chloride channel family protein
MKHSSYALFAFTLVLFAVCDISLAQSRSGSPSPVSLTITVTNDRKEVISGLPQNAFTISDDTGVREIISFSNQDAPMSIALLTDLSGSIKSESNQKKIKSILDSLSQFIQKSHPSNEYFVIGFNTTPYLFLDGARGADTALATLQKLVSVKLAGNTALFDACLVGIEKVARGTYPKQVILLMSDGRDNSSQYKLVDVRRLLKEKNVLLYAINTAMGWDGARIGELNTEGLDVLEKLTSLTGGTIHSPSNAAEMKGNLERIAFELRQQYSMSFLSTKDVSKGNWHPLKIKVSLAANSSQGTQKLSGRSRKGYYSTSFSN